ncbi:cobalamin B12-binding domain-containing protein [Methylobacterium sp. BTF04]|uniref:cobalamin B12-binding domain-containing protein n=1 Tax=Methylobacterium sp. BTF04 TaxID=2708300 RepID=UPI0013D28AA6|nr:cobalamin B12-binding domain-containing protein [Methylobacterium sp. BTF04]NEU14973.1 cobalamin B12-binding domain-containing protein [Methylobacterium sp. BTF04]
MQNLTSSNTAWAHGSAAERDRTEAVLQAYARRRSAVAARQRAVALSVVVQTEIIPRLMLLHPALMVTVEEDKSLTKPDSELISEFTQLLLGPDISKATDVFELLMFKGYSASTLFVDLLSPSAVLLGRLWDEDLCDFIEVTTGVSRLQILVSKFGIEENSTTINKRRRVLLMGAPGEKHSLGLAIVEQFLQRAGWQVFKGLASSSEEIANLVASEWFGVVGLAISCDSHVDQVAASIQAVRRASCNRTIGVMVGGPLFLQHPELVERVGADASAVDAPTAVLLAQRLLDIGMSV